MQNITATVVSNDEIADRIYMMKLDVGEFHVKTPGQFINIKLKTRFLRRPFSVCDQNGGVLSVVYREVGAGTRDMTRAKAGDCYDILAGLGNGFCLDNSGKRPLLIGGGVGAAPLLLLARRLAERGAEVAAVLGFNRKSDVILTDEFAKYCVRVAVTTADGSHGQKGLVTDALGGAECTYHYVCGPRAMMKAVAERLPGDGEYSLEERMGCGFGACLGCTCPTRGGHKRVCKEGPVLAKGEIIW